MKANQEILKEFEKELDKLLSAENIEAEKAKLYRQYFQTFIQQALEQKDREIEELVEQLVPVKDNSKHNKALLKLLNRNQGVTK